MSQLSPILRDTTDNGLMFWCPGCNHAHHIHYGADGWTWNGDVNKPTFTPSVKVTGRDFTEKGRAQYEEWKDAGFPPLNNATFDSADTCCHTYVTDGRIQFLGDCTHALAGQTVDLPEWDRKS